MDVTEPASVIPVIKPHPAEFRFITLDTDPVYKVTKPEYNQSITKPEEAGVFDVVVTLMDNSHKYINDQDNLNPSLPKVIAKDIQILQKSLTAGIWVKTFENRVRTRKKPYAGGLFLFDVKIPLTYPIQPPLCHYYSYCVDRLNPNLYEDGKVCLSLLGTWSGQGVELWSPNDSNLLQHLLSIQGLILVSESYYNEPEFDSLRSKPCKRKLSCLQRNGSDQSSVVNDKYVKHEQFIHKLVKRWCWQFSFETAKFHNLYAEANCIVS
ncbi:uncharacterized protein LOC132933483 [Metopolophium dirhodum]|uniref:uncharacterized protein LOC132933483 n=1 Tax=Metopolophium dirhodum TaxID=44670 RepID=UPI00298FB81E|nr:uncharacterized protein LOC132933483 [Metopolophium dirhodum]